MSFTVYQRILHYEQGNDRFIFHQEGASLVGLTTLNEWKRQGGKTTQLDVIQQIERWGTFMVFEYPKSFLEDVDSIIQKHVKTVIAKGIRKKAISEKPATPTKQQKQNRSGPFPNSPTKRKRIPVSKPAFSGNQFRKY